jgi:hypothetical protein
MTLPLAVPVQAREGDVLEVSFQYRAGGSIPSLQASLKAELVFEAAAQPAAQVPAFA